MWVAAVNPTTDVSSQQPIRRCKYAGDRGFDPLGLAKPTEYLQIDVDELDQNAAKNKPGEIVGEFSSRAEKVSATESLQPYNEVCMPSSTAKGTSDDIVT